MRVIRNGTIPDSDLLVGECSRCTCKVEVAVGEDCIKRRVGFDSDPFFVHCPTEHCCGSITLTKKGESK